MNKKKLASRNLVLVSISAIALLVCGGVWVNLSDMKASDLALETQTVKGPSLIVDARSSAQKAEITFEQIKVATNESDLRSAQIVSEDSSAFDINEFERLLGVYSAELNLLEEVDEESLLLLKIIADSLPPITSTASEHAIRAAISRQITGLSGEDLGTILVSFVKYKEREEALFAGRELSYNPEDQVELMLQQLELRNSFFSPKLQTLLFGDDPASQLDQLEFSAQNIDLRSRYKNQQQFQSPGNLAAESLPLIQESQEVLSSRLDTDPAILPSYVIEEIGAPVQDDSDQTTFSDTDWYSTYNLISDQADIIEDAGISDIEKDKQLGDLFAQHYEPHERVAAKAYYFSKRYEHESRLKSR